MMVNQLVGQYRCGAITASHLFIQLLHIVDPADPSLVLDSLPADLRIPFDAFVREYRLGQMVSNFGILPANDQVIAVQNWLKEVMSSTVSSRVG